MARWCHEKEAFCLSDSISTHSANVRVEEKVRRTPQLFFAESRPTIAGFLSN